MARDESGQVALEYTGVLLVVAAIVVALAGAGVAASIATHIECLVTRIGGLTAGCGSSPVALAPDAPWDAPDPVARATWGSYVSLGDSYSAGEGLGDYQPGACDRSAAAYNATVAGRYGFKDGVRTWACSGATTEDVFDPADPRCAAHGHASGPNGEGCQVARVDAHTSLVTMSIGGNDAGFADDLRDCYTNRARLHWSHPCSEAGPAIDAKIAAMGPKLQAALQAIRARAPHARIVIVTYPRMFPAVPTGNAACVTFVCLTPADQVFFNQEAQKLDDTICGAAGAAGVGAECVDAREAFAGCELGRPDSCLQPPRTRGFAVDPGSFHPSRRGQRVLGELIARRIAQR
jgi:hypothetical protein